MVEARESTPPRVAERRWERIPQAVRGGPGRLRAFGGPGRAERSPDRVLDPRRRLRTSPAASLRFLSVASGSGRMKSRGATKSRWAIVPDFSRAARKEMPGENAAAVTST
jgi:hypothetical protein